MSVTDCAFSYRTEHEQANSLDWNVMFQSILQESPSPSRDAQWFGLTQDFLHNAVTYGKIIISETFIPTRSKTIPPISNNNSGDECYEVYIHKGILYKLYLDAQKNFGSTHHAMKVASNEMKGLRSLFKCGIAGLYFPFSIQIDFQGFRLLAQSGTNSHFQWRCSSTRS